MAVSSALKSVYTESLAETRQQLSQLPVGYFCSLNPCSAASFLYALDAAAKLVNKGACLFVVVVGAVTINCGVFFAIVRVMEYKGDAALQPSPVSFVKNKRCKRRARETYDAPSDELPGF